MLIPLPSPGKKEEKGTGNVLQRIFPSLSTHDQSGLSS
jgi:hypothetical protein